MEARTHKMYKISVSWGRNIFFMEQDMTRTWQDLPIDVLLLLTCTKAIFIRLGEIVMFANLGKSTTHSVCTSCSIYTL